MDTQTLVITIIEWFGVGIAGLIVLSLAIWVICTIYRDATSNPFQSQVKSKKDGREYEAVAFRYNTRKEMELKIYDYRINRYKWYSIYYFDNPFLIAFLADRGFAMNHLAELFTYSKDKKFTEGKKI